VSYKNRNSVALSVLLLLVLGIGLYLCFVYQPGKIQKYQKEIKKIQGQLRDNSEQMGEISSMQNELRETVHRWNNRTKEIPEFDISSQTYGYLSDIIDESGFMKMNMELTGSKRTPRYGYNIYKLSGVSEFQNIFRFIWLLENGRKLYKIAGVSLEGEEDTKDTTEFPKIDVTYDMELHAYFTPEKSLGAPVVRPDSIPQPITSNPFMPSILKVPPPNVKHLLEVDKINVKALSSDKILVMDPNGRLVTLNIGDPVYLGKLTAIYPQEGIAEFTLNSGGIVSVVKKPIVYEKNLGGLTK
jgi:hypothetical protein